MDSTSLQELITLARGAVAELAETEKKVTALKDELAQQNQEAQLNARSALLKSIKLLPKRVTSGWMPADKPSSTRAA
jgi:hypothetical protein